MSNHSLKGTKSIRIDQFNGAMFADLNDSHHFWKVIKSWGAFFLCRDPQFFQKNTEVLSYLNYIKKEQPDIAYVTEVCGKKQRDALIQGFMDMGYHIHSTPGFELWSMQKDSYKFLYHITASKFPLEQVAHFTQYTHNGLVRMLKKDGNIMIRILKSIVGLGKLPSSLTKNIRGKIQGILDGSGSHLKIHFGKHRYLHLGVLHVQTQTSNTVLEELTKSLSKSEGMQILLGDFNAEVKTSEGVIKKQDPQLIHLKTDETYPKIFVATRGWLAKMVNTLAKRYCFRHPDQFFTNKPTRIRGVHILGPERTGLKSDHTYNSYTIEVPEWA